MADLITDRERQKMEDAIRGGCNRFNTTVGSSNDITWIALVARGLAKLIDSYSGTNAYEVTASGLTALAARTPRLRMTYEGAGWVQENVCRGRGRREGKPMSPLGRTVADALGLVWRGIYHLPNGPLSRVDWSDPRRIAIVVPSSNLATFDPSYLTALLVVCHDMMLRMELEGVNQRYVRLVFFQRHKRDGCMGERLPTLEHHAAMLRASYEVITEGDIEEADRG